jgi:hypothetical protein
MSITPVLFLAIALAIASATAWAVQNGSQLTMDGKVISTDVQTIKGRAYIPLNDVAKVLERKVDRKGGTYSLARVTGAPLHEGPSGKMAVNLVADKWQFQVISVQQVSDYSPQYGSDKDKIVPREVGDLLVIVRCRLKNGTKEMREVYFDKDSSGNTALTDDQEHGYVPLAYDSRNSGYSSDKMPPGSLHDFVVLFSIPKDTGLTALTYSVREAGIDKNTEFRVSLKP